MNETTEGRFLALLDDVLAMVKRHGMNDAQGQALFEAAMRGIGTWKVVGITQAAVETLLESDFQMRLVCRAHITSRRETFVALRDRVPRAEAFAFYIASDQTTLTTRAENGRHGDVHWSQVHPMPEAVGALKGYYSVYFTKKQRQAMRDFFNERSNRNEPQGNPS
jgi:hypothetical protein